MLVLHHSDFVCRKKHYFRWNLNFILEVTDGIHLVAKINETFRPLTVNVVEGSY